MDTFPNNTEKERRVVITGGTEGIGRAITEEMLEHNNEVAICARNREKIDEIRNMHEDIIAHQIDLSDRHSARDFIEDSIVEMGGLDVLILNAAVTGLQETKEYVFKVNEVANVVISRKAQASLQENNGSLIFITSGTAHSADMAGVEAYQKSKREIEKWLEDFSKEKGNEKIKIFSINPGSVNTRMHEEILDYSDGDVKARTEKHIEQGTLRNSDIIGKIITRISLSGMQFNPITYQYDLPIINNEVVKITDENILFELNKLKDKDAVAA